MLLTSTAILERRTHLRPRHRIPAVIRDSGLHNALTGPFIYSLAVPFVLLDAWITVYQAICFRVYGIPRVRRSRYFVLDRERLPYLNALEKFNCLYCTYANGVLAYVREVASRTEQYWCPIKHARPLLAAHARYRHFARFGDADEYRRRLPEFRRRFQPAARSTRPRRRPA